VHGGRTVQDDADREFPFLPVQLDIGPAEPGAHIPIYRTNIIPGLIVPDLVKFDPLTPENRGEFPGQKILRQIPGSKVKGGYPA
jgi:hypothetical protein